MCHRRDATTKNTTATAYSIGIVIFFFTIRRPGAFWHPWSVDGKKAITRYADKIVVPEETLDATDDNFDVLTVDDDNIELPAVNDHRSTRPVSRYTIGVDV